MSESEDLVRRGMDAFNARDLEALREVLDPEVELIPMRSLLDGRSYAGYEGMLRFLADMGEDWEKFRIEPVEVVESGDRVLVIGRFHGTGRSGAELEGPAAWISDVRDGRIVRMLASGNPERAREEFAE